MKHYIIFDSISELLRDDIPKILLRREDDIIKFNVIPIKVFFHPRFTFSSEASSPEDDFITRDKFIRQILK